MLVDTHCHLNHETFDGDRAAVQARAHDAGVARLLCIGYDEDSSRRAVALAADNPEIYAAIGIHPESAREWSEPVQSRLRALYGQNQAHVAAYGEIGLDYFYDGTPRVFQQETFGAQIAFAASLAPTLPLIIHCRESADSAERAAQTDILAMLCKSGTQARAVMHCFTGDWNAALACLDAGCFLGIGGVATFKKSFVLREAIARAPLSRLLLETDCPYLAPQGWRGKRNEPSYLPAVAQIVADTKNISLQAVADTTTDNARALFGLA